MNDANYLELPADGDHWARVLSPTVVEVSRSFTKPEPPNPITIFPFASCGAKATATQSGGVVNSVTVVEPGKAYPSAPTVVVTDANGGPGTGATMTAHLTGDHVSSLTIDSGGTGYVDPRVEIVGAVANLPSTSNFEFLVNENEVSISSLSFRRRPYYVAYKSGDAKDIRIVASLCFILAEPLALGDIVRVTESSPGTWWPNTSDYFVTSYNDTAFHPGIHVNQVGYVPTWTKKAYVGYYLGDGGELNLTTSAFPTFKICDADNLASVLYSGSLVSRLDVGYAYSPTPYQKVLEADFTAATAPGRYVLQVPGLGISYPFVIHEGVAMQLARTCALGIYNQRCGVEVGPPYTRHAHNECHTDLAEIPTPYEDYVSSWATIASENGGGAGQDVGVDPITDPESCLYPYVRSGSIDTSGAHHDAGDYSKYTPSVSMFIHTLTFAAQSMGDAGDLDNLGIPESGDGKSDLLTEAKWAADYLLKIQDTDGGFFWLCNPKSGRYESEESLTGSSDGVTQVLWPKTTLSTACAVGALAELGSSPLFRAQFGSVVADSYIDAAINGWDFLTDAIVTNGLTGSFQFLFQSVWQHDDALSYAAASLFAATGSIEYHDALMDWFPDANKNGIRGSSDPTSTYRWSWWPQTFFWGAATRCYAFAARSGRLAIGDLDGDYLDACESEIHYAAQYEMDSANSVTSRNAYGASFQYDAKSFGGGTAGYFFPLEFCFNIAVSHLIAPTTTKFNTVLQNVNYLLGANPVNQIFVSGIGLRRQRIMVQGQSFNDPWRKLPVNGHQVGAISMGVPFVNDGFHDFQYVHLDGSNAINDPIYPADFTATNKYPFYDRWTDTWNINEEWVTGFSGAKSLAIACWLASLTSLKDQAWVP